MTQSEPRSDRMKRLTMRSHRRGIREMDLILGPFADASLAAMSGAELDHFEALLGEADQDLLAWITGAAPIPDRWRALLAQVMAAHRPRPDGA